MRLRQFGSKIVSDRLEMVKRGDSLPEDILTIMVLASCECFIQTSKEIPSLLFVVQGKTTRDVVVVISA